MNWRFLQSGDCSGAVNMRSDQALVQELLGGRNVSTVRVYGWKPQAISLGYHQNKDEIDYSKAHGRGIDIVRRPTGGRAILHADELTYCVATVVRRDDVPFIYGRINSALLTGLRRLGVPAALSFSQPNSPAVDKDASAAVCFSNSARNEIQVEGKKLVGSAQRRYARNDGMIVVLQHGSILIGPQHKRIVDFLRLSEERREHLRDELNRKTTDLKSILGDDVKFRRVSEAVRFGFEVSWGIRLEEEKTKPSIAELT